MLRYREKDLRRCEIAAHDGKICRKHRKTDFRFGTILRIVIRKVATSNDDTLRKELHGSVDSLVFSTLRLGGNLIIT